MRVRDLMSRPVFSARPGSTVREVVTVITEHGYASLPVVDDLGRVVGVVGEPELLRHVGDRQVSPDAPVSSVMVRPVEVAHPADDVSTVAETMLRTGLRCLPVVEEGLLVGVVARRDLLRSMVRDDDVIAAKVRALLDDYAGSRRHWRVEADDGRLVVTGEFADEAERGLVVALCRTVPGVREVRLSALAPTSSGWDD
ncbi:CBS domain-containing protein [Actinokineospora auranticolor]|uniref:BON domain-containing protein n=1 Tax=Actinokineospora auranticolor TaxID=155976 RepID=A0A2S6GIY1_9PSEU|nr:CBS domain-containing protein [Actinokineospora auranticolor]PPK65167.1 BON domain-containing protein [Actinokineospora auranticolor]